MSLTTRIEQDYIAAYKAKDALRLGVLRLLKTAAKNLQVELAAAIDAAIAALGVTNMSGMGKVIQSVMGDYKGRVDGKAVSAAVKARLS